MTFALSFYIKNGGFSLSSIHGDVVIGVVAAFGGESVSRCTQGVFRGWEHKSNRTLYSRTFPPYYSVVDIMWSRDGLRASLSSQEGKVTEMSKAFLAGSL